MKILNMKIDISKLHKKVHEMEDFIKKVEEFQMKAMGQMMRQAEKPGEQKEKLSYIG